MDTRGMQDLVWKVGCAAPGVSEPTVRRYFDILTGVFMVRQLQPWHENLKKHQAKSPKVYLRHSGLLHELLAIRSQNLIEETVALSGSSNALERTGWEVGRHVRAPVPAGRSTSGRSALVLHASMAAVRGGEMI